MNMASTFPLVAILFIFFITPFSMASKFPSILSLACTPPPPKTSLMNNISITVLVDSIVSSMPNYSAFHVGTTEYNGVMQCLPDLTPDLCTFCANNAKQTIQKLCPNATAVTAWFDGCYLQYYSRKDDLDEVTNCSGSKQTSIQDRGHFELKLEALLLRLRAEIYLTTHYRFSTGHIENRHGGRIYALVKCILPLTLEECGACVAKGIDKVYGHCGGKEGGTAANGYCIVRYESYKFFSYFPTNNGGINEIGSGGRVQVAVRDRNRGERKDDHHMSKVNRVEVGLLLWGIGVVCFVVIVFSAWLLKRTITNKAKVAAFGDVDHGHPERERSDGTV
ncbi:putative cysteine-rich repeat secretory protein 25 [Ricinus communis]|uniref:putative cysteine-rich repeat secretory protein 25 n=1 Tax=Ricinus communis TaxID=3988 RepID=UPI00201A88C1|nr:putative cysteine-rich repeat secretory protein 25 [Ricinus communis]